MRAIYRRASVLITILTLLYFQSPGQSDSLSRIAFRSATSTFLENKGQYLSLESKKSLDHILFKVSSAKGDLYITNSGISYVFYKIKDLKNPTQPSGGPSSTQQEIPSRSLEKTHYEIERVDISLEHSNIRRENAEIIYKTGISAYGFYRKNNLVKDMRMIQKVIFHNVYPGIDWILYTEPSLGEAMLKQDFVLRPGADSRNISFRYSGNAKIGIESNGAISVKSKMGEITESRPYVFETGTKAEIPVHVKLQKNRVSYMFSEPWIQKETIIDPDLFWGTFLTSDVMGINYNDRAVGTDVRTDNAGNIYVLLTTTKGVSFPTLNMGNGAYYKDFTGTALGAMNIMKFNRGGVLLWSTFFGDQTSGVSLAPDPFGNLYVDGTGSSTDNIPLKDDGGYYDATSHFNFIVKFSSGGQVMWCSYWGTTETTVSQLLCDSKGNLYVTGATNPVNFPVKNPGGGAYFQIYGNNSFISEFSPTNQLIWSTTIATALSYYSRGRIVVDPSDNLYLMNDSVHMFNPGHQQTWSDITMGSRFLSDITTDRQGDLFAVGFGPPSIAKTDPGNGAFIDNTMNSGISTGFIIKYNPAHQVVWSTSFFNQAMTDIYRVVADQKCDAIHLVGVMNSSIYAVPTINNSCNGGFYFTPGQTATTYAPIFMTFKTSGRRVYTSLTDFPYDYYDQGLAVATDPFGGIICLFGQLFSYSELSAVKDPGNGAFVQSGTNNLSLSAFLMKLVPSKMNAEISVTPPVGCSCNGSAAINVLCGAAPYTYTWNTGANTSSVSGLCSGKYSVTVTDDNCNDTTFSFTIPPAPGSITGFDHSSINAHCNRNDGEIDITAVQGGTAPYQYSINSQSPQNSGLFSALSPGRYQVVVNDVNGCGFRDSVMVMNTSGPSSIMAQTVAASCKLADGSIVIQGVENGSLPFQYSMNSGTYSASTVFSGLVPGKYFIQAKDRYGCSYGDSVEVVASQPPQGAQVEALASHCGQQDGGLNVVSVTGGVGPYAYSLDGNSYQQSAQFNPLLKGNYEIYVRDLKNCVFIGSVQILDIPGPSTESMSIVNAVCNNPYGSMTINSVTNGTRPYMYSLDGSAFQKAESFRSLLPGAYKIYIRDSAGCTLSDNFNITSSISTPIKILPADTAVCYGETILFSVSADAGPGLKTYNWNGGSGEAATFSTIINGQGLINLLVANDSNCVSTASVQVNLKNCDSAAETCVHFPNAFTPDRNGINDGFGVLAHCAVTRYKLNIYNRYGQMVFSSDDVSRKWDGTLNGIPQVTGNYVYVCDYSIGPVKKVKTGSVILVR
jgi:gliding motility-associated-like protein